MRNRSDVSVIPNDWEFFRLSDHFYIYAGGDVPSRSVSETRSDTHPIPIFANALQDQGLYGFTAETRGKADSLTITARGHIGHAEYRPEDFFPIVRLLVLEPNGGLDARFATYAINETVDFAIESTGVPQLTAPQVGKYLLAAPSISEQRTIAEALSDADALVESLDALIAKKRDMKQAAMQRFMALGSTLSGATMVRLGDVVQVRKGELITESTAIPGDVPVIAGGKDAAYHCAHWNRDGLTVTVSASGANAGYVKLRKGRLWASDCSTISESPEYDIRYVAAQLEVRQSKLYQSQFGGAQPHVRPNDIAAIEVCWVDVAQQQMIGEMIADVDAEIDALVAQREKAELVKQGMMQELLSGRVRLV